MKVLKKKIKKIYKKIKKKLLNNAAKLLKKYMKSLSVLLPKKQNRILFISFHGRGYSDNPMALHQYMLEQPEFDGFEFIWAISRKKQKNLDIPKSKIVSYARPRYIYYAMTSKYWVSNCKLPGYMKKCDNQVYLQTWHGTPLKRLAHDIVVPEGTKFYRSGMSFDEMTASYDRDVEKYDYMISPNSFTTEVFQSAFAIDKDKLIETGYPRNDCLSNYTEEDIKETKEKFGIPMDKKVILYAPTWRDNNFTTKGYRFELEVEFQKWQEILGDEYVVLFKPHYLIVNKFKLKDFEGFVYSIPATADISELYVISDMLITDYSSVFFDYAILKRPIYFYMFDLEHYQEELRGFYIDIYKELPGKIFEQEESLLTEIAEGNYDYEFLEEFNTRFNNMEDGNASQRVLTTVFNIKS